MLFHQIVNSLKVNVSDVLYINEKIESTEKIENHLSTELPKSNRNIKKPFDKIPLISNELLTKNILRVLVSHSGLSKIFS